MQLQSTGTHFWPDTISSKGYTRVTWAYIGIIEQKSIASIVMLGYIGVIYIYIYRYICVCVTRLLRSGSGLGVELRDYTGRWCIQPEGTRNSTFLWVNDP